MINIRIGLMSPFLPERCGIAIYSGNLLRELRKKTDVVTIGNKNSDADYVIDFKSWSLGSDIGRIIEKEKIELLHIQYIAAFFGKYTLNLNLLKALKQKIPVVITLHEVHYNNTGLRNKVLCWLEERIVRMAKKVIVHSPEQKRFLEKRCNASNVESIYMGIELKKENKRKTKNILFFGIMSEAKGVDYLIRAMQYLKDYKLFVVGRVVKKEYKNRIIKLAEKLRNVKLDIGWVTEERKRQYFRNSSLLILPYVSAASQSAVLHDAFSYGLPVVTTRIGAVSEIVSLFKCGTVVREGDAVAIAEGIRDAFNNYSKHKKGIEDYRKEANWKRVAEMHKKMYSLLSHGPSKIGQ